MDLLVSDLMLTLPRLKINGCIIFILNFSLKHNEGSQTFKCKPCAEWHQRQELPYRHLPFGGSMMHGLWGSYSVPPYKGTINSTPNSTPTSNLMCIHKVASNTGQISLFVSSGTLFCGIENPFFLLSNIIALQERLSTCAS